MKYSDIEVVFATASPRRRALAQKIKYVAPYGRIRRLLHERGISRICPIFVPTDAPEVTLACAEQTAVANAAAKGEAAAKLTDEPVFAFDTVVGIGNDVFGKPRTAQEAVAMFERLCGATHEVITAVYFAYGQKTVQKSEKTLVTFDVFDKDLVYNYVESGAPFDKAGGYNIDDEAIKPLIKGVCGEYENVVGLPVGLTEKLIEENLIYVEDGYRR